MTVDVKVITRGLQFLNFQGVTTLGNVIVVATVEGRLMRVTPEGVVTPWVDLSPYGIPTGIVGHEERVMVLLSAQETGHYLMAVSATGEASKVADLSDLIGEFGAPFGVAVRRGYYPSYWVAISTDVVTSIGLVAQITPTGKVSILSYVRSSPFGIASDGDTLLVTQEDGNILSINPAGETKALVNLVQQDQGIPLDITYHRSRWFITTNGGWLLELSTDGKVTPVINLQTAGHGVPSTLTGLGGSLYVALTNGTLVRVDSQSEKI